MNPAPFRLLAAALAALAVSALATRVLRALAWRAGLVDRSNERSSHVGAVPRGGGLGLLLGAAAGIAVSGAWPAESPATSVLLLSCAALALVGLLDDRFGLSPLARLVPQLGAAAAITVAAGGLGRLPLPPPLDAPLGALAGGLLAAVWIVAVANFYNFLDGIDGLAGLQAVVTGAGVALAAWDPAARTLGAVLGGASLGFLAHNWAPARIFMGDVGSGTLGFCFAALPLLAPPEARSRAVLFVGVSLFLFLADATWTLLVRVARGERFYEPHREHLYQRLVAPGRGHAAVTLALGLGALALTAAALAAWRSGSALAGWAALAVAVAAFSAELASVRRLAARRELAGAQGTAR
jgi:UDP-N-acetylmuramyl pentapeptide phosphotransferase/UDP-N-acetylglucosamine-1-phosphate transferase